MLNSMSRILTETLVKKALKDLKDSPERSIRNLVDMALNVSDGRFQHELFTIAEQMLEDDQSSYYDIIRDVIAHVESERLLKFGMNLGYNSCTAGAKQIREKEAVCGYNIPWTIALRMDEQRLLEEPERYDRVITQGEELGIYTWMFYTQGRLQDTLPLIRKHTDSAFILFCNPDGLTPAFLDCIAEVNHLMLAVRYEENAGDIYRQLRERQFLYSLFCKYEEKDAENIINGELFYSTEQMHPLFTAVIADKDCPEETEEKVYHMVAEARGRQTFRTIPWEVVRDNSYIDSIISDDSCSACFDVDGALLFCGEERASLNLFDQDLEEILRQAFSKRKDGHCE